MKVRKICQLKPFDKSMVRDTSVGDNFPLTLPQSD